MGIAVGWQRPQPLAAQVRVAGIIIRHSCLNGECPCRVYLHVPAEPSAATPGFQPGNSAFGAPSGNAAIQCPIVERHGVQVSVLCTEYTNSSHSHNCISQ